MMEQAQTLCDRILMLNKGRRVLYGTVDDIRRERGKNSLIVEFAEKGGFECNSGDFWYKKSNRIWEIG